MIGKHSIDIQNRFVRYRFELERNISIIRGDSGTGKTSLVRMISDHQTQGAASGVQLSCNKNCVAMVGLGTMWKEYLKRIKDSIVFIDEGERYVSSEEFASFIKQTDNYYVIMTRNNLYEIPYSVDAIYEIKKSGTYGSLKKTYNSLKKMYGKRLNSKCAYGDNDTIIVEDSKSGYQFYTKVSEDANVKCISAKGKGNIFTIVNKNINKKCLVIADGAAFGPEIDNVYGVTSKNNVRLFLPESFEWLILNSGIIKEEKLRDILANPSQYIESEIFFSWEQFFTDYLMKISKDKQYKYSKNKINKYYLSSRNIKKILGAYFEDM
ncbi:MAG: translation initiation factor 2 [Butyrivibrio sp.]|nr:translation initiation factor 2 [Butyrivibrio sp.]